MLTVLFLIVGLAIILLSAKVFTNGIEWLGKKMKLSEGAVGSVLAAVGTALPEAMIPVVAILFGTGKTADEIGIGAILGAPFMLATLAMFVIGITATICKVDGKKRECMLINPSIMRRDLVFFLVVYSIAIGAAFLPQVFKVPVALFLVLTYIFSVARTVRDGATLCDDELEPLYFAKKQKEPPTPIVVLQVLTALGGIIAGAHMFVDGIKHLSEMLQISPFVLSIIIAPIATELPEKFNSLIWVSKCKDTLAMGNVTGAMVFQSSLIPALGIAMTPWELSELAILSAVLAIIGAAIIYLSLRLKNEIRPSTLIFNGLLYLVFLVAVLIMY